MRRWWFCDSGGGAEPLRESGASGEAGRNQSLRDGVRRTPRRHRFLAGGGARPTPLPQSPTFHHDNDRRRLLHEYRAGQ